MHNHLHNPIKQPAGTECKGSPVAGFVRIQLSRNQFRWSEEINYETDETLERGMCGLAFRGRRIELFAHRMGDD